MSVLPLGIQLEFRKIATHVRSRAWPLVCQMRGLVHCVKSEVITLGQRIGDDDSDGDVPDGLERQVIGPPIRPGFFELPFHLCGFPFGRFAIA